MIFAVLVGVLLVMGFLLNNHLLNYWTRLSFKQVPPTFFIGNAGPLLKLKRSMGEFFCDLYNQHKDLGVFGVYIFYRPTMVVTDPTLVQDIMIRDFTSFHDRPMPVDEKNDPLTGNLFIIPGQKWRDLRVKLSPTFTSGKLKTMLPIIKNCGKVLEDYLVKNHKNGVDVVEFRDLMARFNTNIISSVAFGIDNDCINKPDHIFRKMGAKFFEPSFKNGVRDMIGFLAPNLFHKIKLKFVDQDVEDFIFTIVNQTVDYREKNNYSRNDFMQMLIQLKNQGYVSVDKETDEILEKSEENHKKLDMNSFAAQVFVVFLAGFETSSSTLSFCLFELARNPEIQKKVQAEVDRVFKSNAIDEITYEMLGDLKYLENCVDETLRKYPIVPILLRTATRDYKIADSNLIIPKDTPIMIPVLGFHRDPEIYENPMEFKPERFQNSPHGNGNSKGLFYTPFGDGPRNCIGMRLGKLTTKLGLALIMWKFQLELKDKDMIGKELEFHPNQFVLTPLKPFNIKITPR